MRDELYKELPTIEELEAELGRESSRYRLRCALRSAFSIMIVVAAAAVLISTLCLPVLRIYGTSMTPALTGGNIVVAARGVGLDRGDIVAFYYNNSILVKRIIALPGEWIDIDGAGNVSIDGEPLDEPYQVPDGRYFVMGDLRSISSDSRNSSVGCVAEEQIVGKLFLRVWPFTDFGVIG